LARRYIEDFQVGQVFESRDEYEITPDNLRDFASEFDPQSIHLDASVAAREMFGGIVASGWHALSATMRLIVNARFLGDAPIVGIAIDRLRFLRPVRAGDRLRTLAEVLEVRPSRSDSQRGYLVLRITTLNQSDELVLTQEWTLLAPRRPTR
jgi:acyl dehydratase